VAKIILRPRQNTITRLVRPRPDGNEAFAAFVSDDGFGVYVHRDVLDLIARHARVVTPNEAIGLLAGRICHDPKSGPYTIVMGADAARGGEFRSGWGHVELSAMGHDKVRRRLEDAYPDREVVGWYHTHPQCAPVFSSVDAEEQATWNDPGHIGIVYSGSEPAEPFGVYRGPDARPLHRWTDGRLRDEMERDRDTQEEPAPEQESQAQPIAATRIATPAPNPSGALTPRRRRLKTALLYLVALLFFCLLGGLYWLHYRVQSVEARLRDLAAEKSPDYRPEPPLHSVALPTPVVTPTADGAGPAEQPASLDAPELHPPSKTLSPAVTSGTPRQPAKRRDDSPRRDKPAKQPRMEKKPARKSGPARDDKPMEQPPAPKAEAAPTPLRRN
jgi:proteasome lid subunit RPN8/RPN11